MPSIDDLKKKKIETSKKFQKKPYRPWDDLFSNNAQDDKEVLREDLSRDNVDKDPESSKQNEEKKEESVSFEDVRLEKVFRDLYGAQKSILKYVLNSVEEEGEGGYISTSIAIIEISTSTKIPINTVKATLQKLKKKDLLQSYENKPGRGGYARYKINKKNYDFFSKKIGI